MILPLALHISNRKPLPWQSSQDFPIKPQALLTCLANRHYVKPQLWAVMQTQAIEIAKQFPLTEVVYLDANFPLFDGFPLLPHLSHNDGKKLDLAFFYTDRQGNRRNESPSMIGYGVCEEPLPNEVNQPDECEQKGYWQYSLLKKLAPQANKDEFIFDAKATKFFIQHIAQDQRIGKLLIETHLKNRLQLGTIGKIRLQGCNSVRHDDHLHSQVK